MPEVSVVIPTMNEASSIGAVIDEVQTALVNWDAEILIVDTESRDRTRDIATAKGARVVPEPRRGYGRAYKTGFAAATGTFVGTLDADLTYPASRFPDFLAALAEDRADFVSGNRLSNAPQMMPLFAVARTRAEPLDKDPTPKVPSTESPTAAPVTKRTVPPAATLSDVALGALNAAPPGAQP